MAFALVFPGQGSQYVNMMRELRDSSPTVRAIFDEADEVRHLLDEMEDIRDEINQVKVAYRIKNNF